jgi:ferrous iron transport protein B
MKTIAIAGNPNCGKTSLFNNITGANYHVANYPGVTVEKKEARITHKSDAYNVVDLPGTYSLSPYSLEEVVARDYVVNEKPDVVIDVLDASNLERNLYMFVQFMELEVPVVMALNMMDVAQKRNITIDVEKLAKKLGVPIVQTVARENKGTDGLLDRVKNYIADGKPLPDFKISYGQDIDTALDEMSDIVSKNGFLTDKYPSRWVALKYLENDEQVHAQGALHVEVHKKLLERSDELNAHLKSTLKITAENLIADYRYGYINSILKGVMYTEESGLDRLYWSDKIDMILTHRLLGPLLMLAFLYGIYEFTFWASEYPVGWFETGFEWLSNLIDANLRDGLLKSMLISGVIDGVGGVLGFAPLILFMFFAIALMEDSGYMARTAYMLDRVFRMFGLQGNSVVAYIVSGGIAGGCAVPGVMAARTIKGEKERLITILTAPFMPCGAKLPIYALIIAAFFDSYRSTIMLGITLISWLIALIMARVLGAFVIKEESSAFVMELPPYRMPTLRGLIIHAWERCWMYVKKAGTVILAISILLWVMMTFPGMNQDEMAAFDTKIAAVETEYTKTAVLEARSDEEAVSAPAQELRDKLSEIDSEIAAENLKQSVAGQIGIFIEKLTKYAGFDWKTNIALVGGIAAKEVVVSALGTAYSLGEVDVEESAPLAESLVTKSGWTLANAFSLLVFILLYSPCFVTVVAIAKETGSWKWAGFTVVAYTVIAFIASVVTYQIMS